MSFYDQVERVRALIACMEANTPRDTSGNIAYPVRGWIAKLRYGVKQAERWRKQNEVKDEKGNLGRG